MPTNRYLGVSSTGQPTEVVPAITSSGAASAGQIIALNAAGALDATMLPSGVGATAVTAAAGNLIQYCGKGMSTTELLFIPSTFTVVVA